MFVRVLGEQQIRSAPQLSDCSVYVLSCLSVLHCRVEKRKSIGRNHAGCRGESRMTELCLQVGPGKFGVGQIWTGIRKAGPQNHLKSLKNILFWVSDSVGPGYSTE